MGLARELAARITAMSYDDLPEEALYWGKIAILDTIGVTLAGALEEGPRILDEVLGQPAAVRVSSSALRRRASALDAALVNGTAAHALDFDNTAASLGGHVAAVMVPAMIAAGDAPASSGRISCLRMPPVTRPRASATGLNPEHSEKGWHPTVHARCLLGHRRLRATARASPSSKRRSRSASRHRSPPARRRTSER